MVIVSFPAISSLDVKLNKFDYTIPYQPPYKSTTEYNYIRTEDYILENIQKYQDIDIRFHHQNKD